MCFITLTPKQTRTHLQTQRSALTIKHAPASMHRQACTGQIKIKTSEWLAADQWAVAFR
jgi:hypothetical protein